VFVAGPTDCLISVLFELFTDSNLPFPFPASPPTNAQKQRLSNALSKPGKSKAPEKQGL
jgi:hypothetical protein